MAADKTPSPAPTRPKASPRIEADRTGLLDFREETIYFLLNARFVDPTSGLYPRPGLQCDLDHPPIENRSGLDYHGYDWTRIDPRLESLDAT